MDRGAKYICAAILVAQIAVPVFQLRAERPARFGWHMFAAMQPPPAFGVEAPDGTIDTLKVEDVLAHPRPEIDLERVVPEALCEQRGDALAVLTYTPGESSETARFPCP